MHSKYKTAIALSILVSSIGTVSAANYVGLDYKMRRMIGRNTATYDLHRVLPKSYSGAEFYVGHRFDNDVGLTLGIDRSRSATRNHTFAANEPFLGDKQQAGDRTVIKAKIHATHLDLNGFHNYNKNFEAIGQIGIAMMRVSMDATTYAAGVGRSMAPSKKYRIIPRLGFGLQYFSDIGIGVRGLLNWEGTNFYRMRLTDEDGVRRSVKPFRHSWVFSIGVVGRF